MSLIHKNTLLFCILFIIKCDFLFKGSDNQYKSDDTNPEILHIENKFKYINHITNENIKEVLFVMVIVKEKDMESCDKNFIDFYKKKYLDYLKKKGISHDNILVFDSEIKLSKGKYNFQENEEKINKYINRDVINNRNIKYVIKTYFTYHYLYCYIVEKNVNNKYIIYNPCEIMKISHDVDEEKIKNKEIEKFIKNMQQFNEYYSDFNFDLKLNEISEQILILNLNNKEKRSKYEKYFKEHKIHLDEKDLGKIENSKNNYILWNKNVANTLSFIDFNTKDFINDNEKYLDKFYFSE